MEEVRSNLSLEVASLLRLLPRRMRGEGSLVVCYGEMPTTFAGGGVREVALVYIPISFATASAIPCRRWRLGGKMVAGDTSGKGQKYNTSTVPAQWALWSG